MESHQISGPTSEILKNLYDSLPAHKKCMPGDAVPILEKRVQDLAMSLATTLPGAEQVAQDETEKDTHEGLSTGLD